MPRLAGKGTHYTLAVLDQAGQASSNTVQVPSVTHVLDCVYNKPALQYWTYKQTLQGVAHLLGRYGGKLPQDADSLASLLKAEKRRPMDSRDSAAKSGTDTHDYLEKLLTLGVRARKKLQQETTETGGIQGVNQWYSEWSPSIDKVVSCESVVVSLSGGYAGTLDVCYREAPSGQHVLLDLKTGGVYHTSFLQLAAYKLAWEESGQPAIDKLVILQSHRDGSGYVLHTVEGPEIAKLEQTWRAALELYKNTPKTYRGAVVDSHPLVV